MNKLFISILAIVSCIFLLIPSVIAETTFTEWGNMGAKTSAGDPEILWASGNPKGLMNLSAKTISQTSDYLPFVFDADLDGQNEIYYFVDDAIAMYDSQGDLLSIKNLNGRRGKPCVRNHLASLDSDIEIHTFVNVSGNMTLFLLNKTDETLIVEKIVDVPDDIYPDAYCSFLGDYVVAFNKNYGNLSLIVPETRLVVTEFVNNGQSVLGSGTEFNGYMRTNNAPNFDNPIVVADIDGDTADEVIWVRTSRYQVGQCQQNAFGFVYDTEERNFTVKNKPIHSNYNIDYLGNGGAVSYAQIGSAGSQKEIIVSFEGGGGVCPSAAIVVFDRYFNEKYRIVMTEQNHSIPFAVGDVNQDGSNELCVMEDNSTVDCYDADGNTVYNFATTVPKDPHFMSIGEYNNTNDYSEFLFPCAIGASDDGLTIHSELTLNADCAGSQSIPVIVSKKDTLYKDVLRHGENFSVLYISEGEPALCGDGICAVSETSLGCPEDCFDAQLSNKAQILSIETNPCYTDVIKNNSMFELFVTAVTSKRDGNVQVLVKYYVGQSNEFNSSWSDPAVQGSRFRFNTSLNQTGAGIKVQVTARIYNKSETKDVETILINVGKTGVVYGDTTCENNYNVTYLTPPPETETQVTKTEDAAENTIVKFFKAVGSPFGLSAGTLWLVFMVVSAVSILVMHYKDTRPTDRGDAKLVVISIFLIQSVLFILGIKFGMFSASTVVMLSVLFIIALWLIIRQIVFTNANG